MSVLLQVGWLFLTLSLLAVGGGNAVIPPMQHAAVDVHHWMTTREFLDMFAISRLAPGPGSLIVVLIGQRAAGVAGAVVAVLAMFGPSGLLVYGAARAWAHHRDAKWRPQVEQGLAPVVIGLVFASAVALIRGTETAPVAVVVTAASAVVLTLTDLHPLWVLGLGAAIGFMIHL